jgi:uncharacterized RDD family membrane protein YckC
MGQYDRVLGFTVNAIVQLAPALLVLAVLATGWFNPRTARRFRAALIDVGIVGALMMFGWLFVVTFRIRHVGPFPGAVLGTIYVVFRDALLTGTTQRRSVGKRLMRLRVLSRTNRRSPITPSVLRNLVLVVTAMVGINQAWGRTVITVVVILESLLICFTPKTMRIGDYVANTRVVARERRRRRKSDAGEVEEGLTLSTRRETSRSRSDGRSRLWRSRQKR